jgi:hypothetical protein
MQSGTIFTIFAKTDKGTIRFIAKETLISDGTIEVEINGQEYKTDDTAYDG